MAKTGLPVVLSTGMSDEREIAQALEALSKAKSVILLHCVSKYPSQYEEMNLACMAALRQQFEIPVGLSDHTLDNLSAVGCGIVGCCDDRKTFYLRP